MVVEHVATRGRGTGLEPLSRREEPMEQERCYRRPGWRGGSWAGVEGQAAFVVDARSPHVLLHQAVEPAACVGGRPINQEGTDRLSFLAQLPELGLAPDRLPARPDEPSIGVGTRAQL